MKLFRPPDQVNNSVRNIQIQRDRGIFTIGTHNYIVIVAANHRHRSTKGNTGVGKHLEQVNIRLNRFGEA